MPRLSRALAFFTAFILFFTAFPHAHAFPSLPLPLTAPPEVSAEAAVLLDVNSGTLLAVKNADVRRPMASTTKIMTALVVLETLPTEKTVTVPPEAVGIEGSSIYLYAGEQITVKTLLYALLLSSANDAAVALAIEAGGSIEDFAKMMNEKAEALGLADTHFCNPHGLHHEEHYTTARDLAHLTAAALDNAIFAEIVATARYTAPQSATGATRLFLNHNRLLRTYEGTIGVKTGFTKAAGRCLVSAVRRDDLTLVAVTLAAPNDWRDHAALFDWGFSEYTGFSPTPQPISLPVVGGTASTVTLVPASSPSLTLPAVHGEITCVTEVPRFLFGGFGEGECSGKLIYQMDGIKLCEIELVTQSAVAAEAPLGLFARIKRFFQK